jgi:chromosome segregation ATPase
MRRTSWLQISLLLLGVTGLCGLARAQQARTGGGASAQMVEQLQQLASERTELEASNAKLQKDLDDMRKERDALKSGQQALQHRVDQADAGVRQAQQGVATQRQTNDQEIARWRAKLDEVVAEARKIALQLQEVETDRNGLRQTLTSRDQDLKVCTDRNTALFDLNSEVLTHFEHESVFSRVAQAEPFTKIQRTRLENLILEDKERAEEQRVISKTPAATPATGDVAPH